MRPFTYLRARSIEEAHALFASDPNAALLAGGTCLIDLMKQDVERPSALVDLSFASDLAGIAMTPNGSLRIGAATTLSHVARHPSVRADWPLLVEGIEKGLTPQLRNAATVGGNVAQRPRCFYFREEGFACNKRRPGSGCAAKAGVHHAHAIFGGEETSDCIAVHPSDLSTNLLALDARVEIAGRDGVVREHAFADLHRLPGKDTTSETTLAPKEIITAIVVPAQGVRGGAYAKMPEGGFALAAAAVLLRVEAGLVVNARVVLGGVAHKPWRSREAEAALVGSSPTPDVFAAAAATTLAGAETDVQTAYRRPLLTAVLKEALHRAARGPEADQ